MALLSVDTRIPSSPVSTTRAVITSAMMGANFSAADVPEGRHAVAVTLILLVIH